MIQKEGSGWRFARDISREKFPVLLGGDRWSVEITEKEWISLVSLMAKLMTELNKIEDQLMPEETICLELESNPWWICLDGEKSSWSLQLILNGHGDSFRGFEAFWPVPAAQEITNAMRMIWDSTQ